MGVHEQLGQSIVGMGIGETAGCVAVSHNNGDHCYLL
ncbi:hypothetical protein J2S37_000931 [Corynebacterium felinum]|uniref:Uncharacterized protein n=1 Tax=Corynebacterium felinum TaxID=131318 RepID=A0ABU2B714_9CORY|nr:hypothetical protein [Corynebacterium felinum]